MFTERAPVMMQQRMTLTDLVPFNDNNRFFFEHNPLPMWIMDQETFSFLDVNERAVLEYGYSRDEFLSMTALDIRPFEEKNRFIRFNESFISQTFKNYQDKWLHRKKDGTIFTVCISVKEINYKGRAAKIIIEQDVTEKIKADEKLASSEARFRTIIENSNEIITLCDTDFKIIYRSPSASRITSWSNDEMEEMGILSIIHPDDKLYIQSLFESLLMKPGERLNVKFRNQHKDGRYLWSEGTAVNLLSDSNIKAIVFNFRDTTEWVNINEKWKASEMQFRALIENSWEGIVMTDENSNTLYASPGAERILGDNVNLNLSALVHPKDADEIRRVRVNVLQHPGMPYPFQGRFIHTIKDFIWVEGTVTNMLNVKGVSAIVINFRNITERKLAEIKIIQSEENMAAILENASEGFVLMDTKGIIKAYNEQAKISILTNVTENIVEGKHILQLVPLARHGYFEKLFSNVLTGQTIHYERSYIADGGRLCWISYTLKPVKVMQSITGVCITGRDITEKKIADQQKDFDQNNLHALINNTDDLMWSVDTNFRLITSNHAYDLFIKKLYGKIPINRASVFLETRGQQKNEMFKEHYERAFEGETFTIVHYEERPEPSFNEISFYPIYEANEIIGTACFSRDITALKKAEAVMYKTQSRLQEAQAISHLGHWEMDIKTNVTKWSDEKYRIYGLQVGDPIHHGYWLSFVHPDDVTRVNEGIESSQASLSEFSMQYRIIRKDGGVRYVNSISRYEFNKEGMPSGIYGILHDITDIRLAEEDLKKSFNEKNMLAERLSKILNTLPANIALLDEKGFIIDVNDGWRNFAIANGYHGSSFGVGDNYLGNCGGSAIIGNEVIDVAKNIKAIINHKMDEFVMEYSCHAPGEKRWFKLIATPLQGKTSRGAVVMHLDISRIKQMEEDRLRSKAEEQLNITKAMISGREKERNALGIELHDNVNQILVGTKLVMGRVNDEIKNNKLLLLCIDNISLAINENRKLAHELVTPDLVKETIVEQIQKIQRNMLEAAGLKTELEVNGNVNSLSAEQKLAAYRVAQEQCTNILKHSGATTVEFELHLSEDEFVMRIKDNGKGIKTTKVQDGIGLKNITTRINVLQGIVDIDSAPGKGFMLQVRFPLIKKAA